MRRHYNVWAEIRVSGLPGPGGSAAGSAKGSAAAVLDVLRRLRNKSGGSDGFRKDGIRVALPELAREAGVSPAAAQAQLTRLIALRVVRATGRGVLADVLIKPGPLNGRELRKLQKRFESRSAVEVGHLEDIGHYASLKTCRRARLLSYFGDGDAELVAPCDGCDICQDGSRGGGKRTRRRTHASNPPNPGTSSILGRALNGLREAVFGTFATDGTEAAARK